MDEIYLSVIIPAYNEERRLPHTLKSVAEFLKKQPYTWETLVVDDGSSDGTADLVRAFRVNEGRIRLLQYGTNRGKGYAVRYGMLHSTGAIRVFMDADNSTTIDHIQQFLKILNAGTDIVIGSREAAGAEVAIHQPVWKELLGDLGNFWIQFWAAPGIRDTQAGFKAFTAKAAQDIFSRLTLDRWGFDVEALAVAKQLGYSIAEQPIRWVNDPDSKVSVGAYVQVLREVVQVRLNIWKKIYVRVPKQA